MSLARCRIFSLPSPATASPDTSPFTSAMNTARPPRETLGQGHQGHRLAGTGRAGDQTMAIPESGQQRDGDIVGGALAQQDGVHVIPCDESRPGF